RRAPRRATPLPYTTLFRSRAFGEGRGDRIGLGEIGAEEAPVGAGSRRLALDLGDPRFLETRVVIVVETVETDHRVTTRQQPAREDRKSTRLNSSHVKTSYA